MIKHRLVTMPPRTRQDIRHENGALQTTFKANRKSCLFYLLIIKLCWLLAQAARGKHGGKGRGRNAVPSDPDGINLANVDSNGKALVVLCI